MSLNNDPSQGPPFCLLLKRETWSEELSELELRSKNLGLKRKKKKTLKKTPKLVPSSTHAKRN